MPPAWPVLTRRRRISKERALSTQRDDSARESALSAFLEERIAQGFRVESRTDMQAIIVPPRRFSIVPARLRRSGDGRQVVSVDAGGVVTARPAEPLRW